MAQIEWDPEAIVHMRERHGVSPSEAEEALDDFEAIVQSPDPASESGISDRTIGWCASRNEVLVVISIRYGGQRYGGNAWPANATQRRIYEERRSNGQADSH